MFIGKDIYLPLGHSLHSLSVGSEIGHAVFASNAPLSILVEKEPDSTKEALITRFTLLHFPYSIRSPSGQNFQVKKCRQFYGIAKQTHHLDMKALVHVKHLMDSSAVAGCIPIKASRETAEELMKVHLKL